MELAAAPSQTVCLSARVTVGPELSLSSGGVGTRVETCPVATSMAGMQWVRIWSAQPWRQ